MCRRSRVVRTLAIAVLALLAVVSLGAQKVTLRIAYPTGGEMPVEAMKNAFKEFSKANPSVSFKELTAPMVDFENIVLKTILADG